MTKQNSLLFASLFGCKSGTGNGIANIKLPKIIRCLVICTFAPDINPTERLVIFGVMPLKAFVGFFGLGIPTFGQQRAHKGKIGSAVGQKGSIGGTGPERNVV